MDEALSRLRRQGNRETSQGSESISTATPTLDSEVQEEPTAMTPPNRTAAEQAKLTAAYEAAREAVAPVKVERAKPAEKPKRGWIEGLLNFIRGGTA